MRLSLSIFLFLTPTLVHLESTTKNECNYVTLVRCFITILDEWAWALYELKDNVVTITKNQCEHLEQLGQCVKDDFTESDQNHKCSHTEVVEASNTVTDLLTHRKNSGTFLKSYYLLTYACSPRGQEVLKDHRECLRKEKIGEMTLAAGTYLTDKFLQEGDDETCQNVQDKLTEYVTSMSGLCKNEAADIMCQSLIHMFKGLHADKLSDCELTCPKLPDPTEAPIESAPPVINEPDAQQGMPKMASINAVSFSIASVLFTRFFFY